VLLDRLQIIPFEIELRDTIDAALFQFNELKTAAKAALVAQNASRASRQLTQQLLDAQGRAQSRTFDQLEAFLAAFSRVSLLIFPVSNTSFTKRRAETMQRCLNIDRISIVADREFRDSWVHHDERLDRAVKNKTGRSGQAFCRSDESPASKLETFLRVIELDTLVVHYRARDGAARSANLKDAFAALKTLDRRRKRAFDQLSVPDCD